MAKDVQSLSSSIIEISSKNNITKEITMVVHKIDVANGNGLDFIEEYVEKYKDSILNKPVVAKYLPIKDDLGHHEPVFDSNGNIIGLETIAIGTIKEVWIDDLIVDDSTTVKALYTKADLWSYKYPEIITCVEKLFNSNQADSSVEVEIYKYGEEATQEYRYPIDYVYLSNCLLGETITPADSDAGIISISHKEIAMAIQTDLQNIKDKQEGDVNVPEKELFNKGYKTKFHIETNELSHDDIRQQIYNLINPVNPKTDERSYKYWIREVFQTKFIIEAWEDGDKLYMVDYSISGDLVTISSVWTEVEITYQPIGSNLESDLVNLQDELFKVKEELSAMSETKTKEVSELEAKVIGLEEKITELNSTIVTQEEVKSNLEGQLTELNSSIEDLTKYKVQVEAAEKEVKLTEVSSRYEKLLSADVFKSEEVQNAIQELNTQKLNELVVNEVAKQKVEVSSIKDESVTVIASKQEDLIAKDILQKYGIKA